MRLDVYLHTVCLVKSRSLAKEACVRGRVTVNGAPAKGSRSVHPGDRLRVDLGFRILELEIVEIPPGRVSKKDAGSFYRMLSNRTTLEDMERTES